ncbi:Suppressor of SWI4 1 homolog [Seminavis robusta]|uniref:Suppressor of SWI4 1 homolog n=1 Tax=Seminavis robusta TaxID=568900 RepID=A0A9N8DTT6_9STRA|nr:Suppressor of SWI4 1 homolog [Seminavis robusta]|eukprot:Sro351_g124070.1 Suppressor of SWI4 1 homolog (446) ;mRNA; r:69821-71158
MPKKGRGRKKNRTHVKDLEESKPENALVSNKQETKVPKSLVIRRGKTEHEVAELVEDLRKLMLPYTALQFQEDPRNRKLTLEKYCQKLALPMGITHIMAFTQNETRLNLRLARTPEGPTITFRVTQFSLNKHIKSLQRRPMADNARALHQNPPIVVTNNFGDASAPPQIKLLRITFQNMFPAINVASVRLADCRRVVLFHLVDEEVVEEESSSKDDDKTTKTTTTRTVIKQRVQIRHYAIKANPVGVNRKVRRLIQSKLPNLNKVQDIADYITGQQAGATGDVSDSEAEEDPQHQVVLPQSYGGNVKSQKSALKLVELGPRLSLELIKVEKGLGGGDVMFHAYEKKTPEEAKALKERKDRERNLKQQRKEEQQRNVDRKRKAEDEKRVAKRKRKEEREQATMEALRQGGGAASGMSMEEEEQSDDDNSKQDESESEGDNDSGSDE